MYVEFFGLPGAGKSTVSQIFNDIVNKDSKHLYRPAVVMKVSSTYGKFLLLTFVQSMTSPRFLGRILRRPVYFTKFLKGMLVKFIVAHRHIDSGYYLSDHGLIQTLSQSDTFRKELINDNKFLFKIITILPRGKSIQYIYLRSDVKSSIARIIARDKQQSFSKDFLMECAILFETAKKYFNAPVVATSSSKQKIIRDVNAVLKKKAL